MATKTGTKVGSRTGIKLTKKNRIAILSRAREIISDPKRWTHGRLRRKTRRKTGDAYCLLGACEQAVYDLGLAEPDPKWAFQEEWPDPDDDYSTREGLGYAIGKDISLYTYSTETREESPESVNDRIGHEGALKLLDDYLAEVKKGKARDMKEGE